MPDDAAAAVGARRRQPMDRTLEAVERMRLAVHDDLESLVILVPASFAACHNQPPGKRSAPRPTAPAMKLARRNCNRCAQSSQNQGLTLTNWASGRRPFFSLTCCGKMI